MTELANETLDVPTEVADAEDYAISNLSLAPARRVSRLRQPDFADGVRSELRYVMNIRQLGQMYLASHPETVVQNLLWRLIASVAIAVSLAACGATLTAIALVGGSVEPNPYISLAMFLVGVTLCSTVAVVLRGRRPALRGRR